MQNYAFLSGYTGGWLFLNKKENKGQFFLKIL
jgi:hypothetical protein